MERKGQLPSFSAFAPVYMCVRALTRECVYVYVCVCVCVCVFLFYFLTSASITFQNKNCHLIQLTLAQFVTRVDT